MKTNIDGTTLAHDGTISDKEWATLMGTRPDPERGKELREIGVLLSRAGMAPAIPPNLASEYPDLTGSDRFAVLQGWKEHKAIERFT